MVFIPSCFACDCLEYTWMGGEGGVGEEGGRVGEC